MSKLLGDLLVAVLIALEILCVALTVFVIRSLRDKVLMLSRFKRLDLEFAGAGTRQGSLYWRRDKAKISFYVALDVVYAVAALAAVCLIGLVLLRIFRVVR